MDGAIQRISENHNASWLLPKILPKERIFLASSQDMVKRQEFNLVKASIDEMIDAEHIFHIPNYP